LGGSWLKARQEIHVLRPHLFGKKTGCDGVQLSSCDKGKNKIGRSYSRSMWTKKGLYLKNNQSKKGWRKITSHHRP
jgi:hypothetical protein